EGGPLLTLRPLVGSLRARSRSPDLARARWFERDPEPVARAVHGSVGRAHEGRPGEPPARAGVRGAAGVGVGAAPGSQRLGRGVPEVRRGATSFDRLGWTFVRWLLRVQLSDRVHDLLRG